MFILLSETDLKQQSAVRDAFRSLGAGIDRAVYGLMGLVFQLFFSVASADIFSSGMISKFYTRVQLIIGVFVLFQLAMTVLRGIVNPEGFTDSKSGAGNIVMRICTALVMLAMIVPINIPSASNEFEKQINNNGLLFGTLYSLQHRILSNNTIGKVVMGVGNNKDGETNYMNTKGNAGYKEAANVFTSTIIKGFYRINLIPEEDRKHENGKEDDQINENRVCTDIPDEVINTYKRLDADPSDITDLINTTCNSEGLGSRIVKAVFHPIKTLTEGNGKVYAFTFMPVISSIIGVLFVVILLSFCVDVAMRAIKLAVLRLLAPIPIISYMDPKGGKDGAFGAWTKLLISTYLDLFIRVASVYFVIYMIQEMLVHGITTNSTGALKVFTVLFIWVGLFYFAKEAPKFIKQALGMKDDGGGGLFSGVGKIAGIGAAAGGMIGSGIASARASKMADETREAYGKLPEGASNRLRNKGKHLLAGITGGLAGGVAGGAAAMTAKDHQLKNAMEAMQKRNASALAKGADGSTLFGRMGSSARGLFKGEGSAAGTEREIAGLEGKRKALDAIKSRVSGEMVKQNWTYGTGGKGFTGKVNGKDVSLDNAEFNYKKFMADMKQAEASGSGRVTLTDKNGVAYDVSYSDAEMMRGTVLKNNEDSYIGEVVAGNQSDAELISLIQDAEMKGAASSKYDEIKVNGEVVYTRPKQGHITSRDDYTKVAERMGQEAREKSRENTINKSNDRYSGNK